MTRGQRAIDERLARELRDRPRGEGPRGMPGGMEAQREMMQMIRELRSEVQQLRREVRELREGGPRKEEAKDAPKGAKAILGEVPYLAKLFRDEKRPDKVKPQPKVSIGFSKDGATTLEGTVKLDIELKKEPIEKVKDVEIEFKKAPVEKVKDVEIEFKKAPVGKVKDVQIEFKKAPVEKIKDVEIELKKLQVEKIKDVEIELKKSQVEKIKDVEIELKKAQIEKLKKADVDLKSSLETLKHQDIKSLEDQAASDIEVRYAAKAAEVWKNELQRALEANEKTKGAVSDLEIQRLKLGHERASLEIERAKREQLDRLLKLKKELQEQAKR